MQLSEHFTKEEFEASWTAKVRGLSNKMGPKELSAAKYLCNTVLEPIRAHYGKPIVLSSGYRNPAVNAAVGSGPTSQHVKGEAADFHVAGLSPRAVFDDIRKGKIERLVWDQLIYERDTTGNEWVHISRKPFDNRRMTLVANFSRSKKTTYTVV